MKWGFLAYGHIAKKFMTSIALIEEASVHAIASKSNYENLSSQFPDIQLYQSYDELIQDPNLDIIYISTTHNYHHENVIKALKAGKHVLCEKPLGIHPNEVKSMIETSKIENRFLMEAVWTRFLPAYSFMKKAVDNGDCGDIKLIKGDFSFDGSGFDKESRLRNPNLAAGAIWDVGLYPISMAVDIFNERPTQIIASGITDENNVDLRSSIILNFGKDKQALIHCGIDLETIHDGQIFGTKSWVHLDNFWHGKNLKMGNYKDNQRYVFPLDLPTSFSYEIRACYEAIAKGKIEHPRMSHEHSLIISEIMEEALRQVRES